MPARAAINADHALGLGFDQIFGHSLAGGLTSLDADPVGGQGLPESRVALQNRSGQAQITKSTTTSRSDLSAARSGLRGADYSTVIKQQLEEMNDGNRGTTLISVVTSLVGRGFSRAQIIRIANKPYLERFANDEDHGPAYLDKIIDNAERAIERRPWGGTT